MAAALVDVATNQGASSSGGVSTGTHGITLSSGDFVVVIIHRNDYSEDDFTDNNGAYAFDKILERDGASSNTVAVFARICGASEPTSYNFTDAWDDAWSIQMWVFSGLDTSSTVSAVWDVAPGTPTPGSGSGSTWTAPSIDTGEDGCMVLAVSVSDGDVRSATSVDNSFTNLTGWSSPGRTMAGACKVQASAGTVGATAFTADGTDDYQTWQFSMKAAAGAPPSVVHRLMTCGAGQA